MGSSERFNPALDKISYANTGITRREFLVKGLGSLAVLHPAVTLASKWTESLFKPEQQRNLQELGLPADVISAEELESRYKTRIHNFSQSDFPQDYVELYLRHTVATEPLFEKLENFDQTLDIYLVNSFTVNPATLTYEQYIDIYERKPEVLNVLTNYFLQNREANRQEIEVNRYIKQLEYYTRLQELENRRALINEDEYSVESSALIYFYSRYFRNVPTEEDLRHPNAIHGLFYPREIASDNDHNNYIFLAVRDLRDGITITQGNTSLTIERSQLNAPKPSQSYPTIVDFPLLTSRASDESYVVQPSGPGQTLRHEFVHENRLFTEAQADLLAVSKLVEAGEYFQETGSDELYWAVFRTPEGLTIT